MTSESHRCWQNSARAVCTGGQKQIADRPQDLPSRPCNPQPCPHGIHGHLAWQAEQKSILPRQKKRALYPSAAEPSPQADTEAKALLGHGDLLTAYSPLFQNACQCLCCFTLCFPQRSWINTTSAPQGIPALVSLWLFTAAAEVYLRGLSVWEDSRTSETSPVPWMAELAEEHPLAQRQEQLHFSGLGTLRKGNILKCSFCFPTGTF